MTKTFISQKITCPSIKMKQLKNACSPANLSAEGKNAPGCLDYPMLLLITRLYNQHFPDAVPIKVFRDPVAQFNAIDAAMTTNPKVRCAPADEVCWAHSLVIAHGSDGGVETAIKNKFRPIQPKSWRKNPKEWLSNEDIDAVMRQYATASRGRMRFVGVFPIDFAKRLKSRGNACVSPELCSLDISEEIRQGTQHLGIVLNTDPHHKSGQHWISMYIGLDPRHRRSFGVHFYDSVAKPPPTEIKQLMDDIVSQMKSSLGQTNVPVHSNKIRRQYQNTECGIYSMLFILRMMSAQRQRTTFEDICQSMGTDQHVAKYRDKLFVRPQPVPKSGPKKHKAADLKKSR